ncbi:hypothetical protein HHK36_032446 [Tetracentron sinense]|uniref:Uncharacterized protein n=1 Tax=Tetracentron sinense TaxID=13715 RepID=A0A834Y530_TETSI|nr:hypothetical protein HHK36_032446 [Tetracentron sinense]
MTFILVSACYKLPLPFSLCYKATPSSENWACQLPFRIHFPEVYQHTDNMGMLFRTINYLLFIYSSFIPACLIHSFCTHVI